MQLVVHADDTEKQEEDDVSTCAPSQSVKCNSSDKPAPAVTSSSVLRGGVSDSDSSRDERMPPYPSVPETDTTRKSQKQAPPVVDFDTACDAEIRQRIQPTADKLLQVLIKMGTARGASCDFEKKLGA